MLRYIIICHGMSTILQKKTVTFVKRTAEIAMNAEVSNFNIIWNGV